MPQASCQERHPRSHKASGPGHSVQDRCEVRESRCLAGIRQPVEGTEAMAKAPHKGVLQVYEATCFYMRVLSMAHMKAYLQLRPCFAGSHSTIQGRAQAGTSPNGYDIHVHAIQAPCRTWLCPPDVKEKSEDDPDSGADATCDF